MERNAKCFCGSGLKQKNCHRDIEPNSVLANYILLTKKIEEQLTSAKNPCDCKKGCDECCYQLAMVTQVEFIYICYTWLRNNRTLTELFTLGEVVYQATCAKNPKLIHLFTMLENTSDTKEFSYLIEKIYQNSFKFTLPCPLLDISNRCCQLYEARPLICRTHGLAISKRDFDSVSYIPCSKHSNGVSKDELVDIEKFNIDILDLSMYTSNAKDTIIYDVSFPIFYFCHLGYTSADDYLTKVLHMQSLTKPRYSLNMIKRQYKRIGGKK